MILTLNVPDDLVGDIEILSEQERSRIANATLQAMLEQAKASKTVASDTSPTQRVANFDAFLRDFQEGVSQEAPPLSDFAVSRAGIYEE